MRTNTIKFIIVFIITLIVKVSVAVLFYSVWHQKDIIYSFKLLMIKNVIYFVPLIFVSYAVANSITKYMELNK